MKSHARVITRILIGLLMASMLAVVGAGTSQAAAAPAGPAVVGAGTAQAAAAPAGPGDRFGAFAYSPSTQAAAWARDQTDPDLAELLAVGKCTQTGAPDCRWVYWFENAWAAMAFAPHVYGVGADADQGNANYFALKNCIDKGGQGCNVVFSIHS